MNANAQGHLLAAAASEGINELWDLLNEFSEMTGDGGPGIHAFPPHDGLPRYCVHPDSKPGEEFRADDLREALLSAAAWKARMMPEDLLWSRG